MTRRRHRQHTREFKLTALARMDGAADVQALARELDVDRTLLYQWQRLYIRGGAEALRNSGRPRPVLLRPSEMPPAVAETVARAASAPAEPPVAGASAQRDGLPRPLAAHDPSAAAGRIAELERKIGQQQLDLDFFRAALRHVRGPRR